MKNSTVLLGFTIISFVIAMIEPSKSGHLATIVLLTGSYICNSIEKTK